MPMERIIMAVNLLDLKQVPLESVEILQRMIPTDQEVSFVVSYFSFFFINMYKCITYKFFKF